MITESAEYHWIRPTVKEEKNKPYAIDTTWRYRDNKDQFSQVYPELLSLSNVWIRWVNFVRETLL